MFTSLVLSNSIQFLFVCFFRPDWGHPLRHPLHARHELLGARRHVAQQRVVSAVWVYKLVGQKFHCLNDTSCFCSAAVFAAWFAGQVAGLMYQNHAMDHTICKVVKAGPICAMHNLPLLSKFHLGRPFMTSMPRGEGGLKCGQNKGGCVNFFLSQAFFKVRGAHKIKVGSYQ